jgi:magnesium-transporting ATPase (P-type)
MQEKPKSREEPILNQRMLHQILFTGGFTVLLCAAFLAFPAIGQWFRPHPDDLYRMSAFFALFIFCGIFNCFNARTHRINLLAGLHRNPTFIAVMLLVSAVQLCLIYFGGTLFRTTAIGLHEWIPVLRLSLLVIPFDIARKLALRLSHRNDAF